MKVLEPAFLQGFEVYKTPLDQDENVQHALFL